MSPHSFIAIRYLKSQRKGLFTLITTIIGITGVSLGVAALIITLSIMNGFQNDIKKKILDFQANIVIYGNLRYEDYNKIKNDILSHNRHIVSVSPFFMGQGILSNGDITSGIVIKGINIADEFKINNLDKSLKYGSWEDLNSTKTANIVIGSELANNIGVWINDNVVLVSPKMQDAALGIIPKMKKFRVSGIVNTGYYEFDSSFAYSSIENVNNFFGNSYASGISIKLDDIDNVDMVLRDLKNRYGALFNIKSYADMNKNLFSALKLEKFMMTLVLSLIIIVATFTITSNLLITSVEKIKDIGILRAMGARPAFIMKIFLYEGVFIAIFGIAIGFILGLGISWIIKTYPIITLPGDIYYITKVPVKIEFMDLLYTAVGSFLMCLLSSLFPAIKASKINPIEAIRYG
jgi:lipoprotein-releasing system permease protein